MLYQSLRLFIVVVLVAGISIATRCYDVTCFEEKCLEKQIVSSTARTCEMDSRYGCSYTKMVSDSIMYVAQCASMECRPYHSAPSHDTLCCNTDLCNDGHYRQDNSSTANCVSYMCTSGWSCLESGIANNYTRTCPMDPKYGCFLRRMQQSGSILVQAGCSDSTCSASKLERNGDKIEESCCTGNLCNDGSGYDNDHSGEGRCVSYTCTGEWNCLESGTVRTIPGTCVMDPNYGCFVLKTQGRGNTFVKAGCSSSSETCQSTFVQHGDSRVQKTCCTTHLCNKQTQQQHGNAGQTSALANIALVLLVMGHFLVIYV